MFSRPLAALTIFATSLIFFELWPVSDTKEKLYSLSSRSLQTTRNHPEQFLQKYHARTPWS